VVWNPGPERPRILADLGDDDWRRFVCVESGNVGRGAVTVAPGAGHRRSIRIQSEPWDGA
jgi:glucose-6-phosphate 1-epimerase